MVLHGADGKEYKVHFFYATIDHDLHGPRRMAGCHMHTGVCLRVNDSPCQAVGGEGTTIFNPNDKYYTKVKGRSYALARAMKSLGLPRSYRAPLWAEYIQRVGLITRRDVESEQERSVQLPPPQDPLGYTDEELKSFMSEAEWHKFHLWMVGQTVAAGADGKARTYPWDAKRGLELIRFGRPTYFD